MIYRIRSTPRLLAPNFILLVLASSLLKQTFNMANRVSSGSDPAFGPISISIACATKQLFHDKMLFYVVSMPTMKITSKKRIRNNYSIYPWCGNHKSMRPFSARVLSTRWCGIPPVSSCLGNRSTSVCKGCLPRMQGRRRSVFLLPPQGWSATLRRKIRRLWSWKLRRLRCNGLHPQVGSGLTSHILLRSFHFSYYCS